MGPDLNIVSETAENKPDPRFDLWQQQSTYSSKLRRKIDRPSNISQFLFKKRVCLDSLTTWFSSHIGSIFAKKLATLFEQFRKVGQSQKTQKLSGQQDSRKNFPDKARESQHWQIRDKYA